MEKEKEMNREGLDGRVERKGGEVEGRKVGV